MTALFNLSHLHTSLASGLVGLSPDDEAWVESPFPAGDPVVELVGDRASGKTALLTTLHEEYRNLVPTVYADLAGEPFTAPDEAARDRLDTHYASPVTNILYVLTHRLNEQKLRKQERDKQALRFERASTALYVVSAWRRSEDEEMDDLAPEQLAEAETELASRLTQLQERQVPENDDRVQAAVNAWLTAGGAVLSGLVPVPGVGDILVAAQQTLRAWSAGKGGDGQAWWGSRLPGLDPPIRKLFDLAQQFRSEGARRKEAEGHLIAAFLADIDASYGWWRRKTRHPPLILLDNLDDALRERWLRPFTEQFAGLRRQRAVQGRVMRPAVLTTSLGAGQASPLVPATHPAPWSLPQRVPPASWLLRLGIPQVTPDEIDGMLRRPDAAGRESGVADRAVMEELVTVIGRLSGGRTGSALLLTGAATDWLDSGEPAHGLTERLLGLPAPEDDGSAGAPSGPAPTVAERLLEHLLPDPGQRAQALRTAPVLDEAAAVQLDPRPAAVRGDGGAASAVRNLLTLTLQRDHWHHRPWRRELGGGPLITDRALRAVLLHQLRNRIGGESWELIHRRLLAHYGTAGAELDPLEGLAVSQHAFRLHHALAQGDLDTVVVPALHQLYARRPPAQVLAEINVVAAAPEGPAAPPETGPDTGTPGLLPACPDCADQDTHQVHKALRNLVASVWRLSSPLAARPARSHPDVSLMRTQLGVLAADFSSTPEHARVVNSYAHAIDGWENALVRGAQAPDLPVQDGGRH